MHLPSPLIALLLITACVPGYQVAPPSTNQSRRIEQVELAQQGSRPMRLAVVGDIHQKFEEPNRGNGARVARAIAEHARREPIDAILLLGDNFDPCGVRSRGDQAWQLVRETFLNIGVPVFPVLGNHDYGNPKWRYGKLWICGQPNPAAEVGISPELTNWRFPSRSYRIRTPAAELFMLDTTPIAAGLSEPLLGGSTSAELLAWLRRDLPSVRGWRIVAGHHHLLASGKERRKSAATHERMQSLRQLLIEEEVDLYLSGHRHHLELIVPRKGERHPILLVSGAGGRPRPLEEVREGLPPTLFPSSPPQGHVGYAVVEIGSDDLAVVFYDGTGRAVSRRFDFRRQPRKAAPRQAT